MSLTSESMSPADIRACCGNGYDNGGMFGDNAWWIIILLLFGWGRNGWGSGNNGSGAADGYVLATDFANIERKLDGINNGICDSTFALNNTINGNFRTLDGAVCNLGYQALQNTNAIQTQLADCCCKTQQNIERNTNQGILNTNELSRQISDCCCNLEKMDMQTRFDNQAYNCNTLQAIDKLGDRIIDYMAAEKAQALRDENFALRLSASQAQQNEVLKSYVTGQFAYYNPRPVPSYGVPAPYPYCYGAGGCCA